MEMPPPWAIARSSSNGLRPLAANSVSRSLRSWRRSASSALWVRLNPAARSVRAFCNAVSREVPGVSFGGNFLAMSRLQCRRSGTGRREMLRDKSEALVVDVPTLRIEDAPRLAVRDARLQDRGHPLALAHQRELRADRIGADVRVARRTTRRSRRRFRTCDMGQRDQLEPGRGLNAYGAGHHLGHRAVLRCAVRGARRDPHAVA